MKQAIKDRPLTSREIRERVRIYQIASHPFIKILSNLEILFTTKLIMYPNGELKKHYTDEYYVIRKQVTETLALLRKEILEKGGNND